MNEPKHRRSADHPQADDHNHYRLFDGILWTIIIGILFYSLYRWAKLSNGVA